MILNRLIKKVMKNFLIILKLENKNLASKNIYNGIDKTISNGARKTIKYHQKIGFSISPSLSHKPSFFKSISIFKYNER